MGAAEEEPASPELALRWVCLPVLWAALRCCRVAVATSAQMMLPAESPAGQLLLALLQKGWPLVRAVLHAPPVEPAWTGRMLDALRVQIMQD